MSDRLKTVKDIGEQGLLKLLQVFCPADIIGDDGAVIAIASEQNLVITTDVLVDGVHFSEKTTTPEDVGWRAAAANLSDLAAMGASGVGITVGLSLPPNATIDWVMRLYQGLNECLTQYQTPILGGDVCRSPVITVAITALGQVYPHRVIKRANAQVGDAILVTGVHGASRAGLELLLHSDRFLSLPQEAKQALILAHQRPKPRLDVLPHLWELEGEFRVGGMDSSDGLADAVIQICRCSKVGAKIEADKIPLPPLIAPEQALEWALYGGEDFELVLCLPEKSAQILLEKLDNKAAIIGKITPDSTVELIDSRGILPKRILTLTEGFQHF